MKAAIAFGGKFHRVASFGGVTSCGQQLASAHPSSMVPAYSVPSDQRCLHPGCRGEWPPHLVVIAS